MARRQRWSPLNLLVVAAVLSALASAFGLSNQATAASPNLVISQVYGGGGNSGAPFTHDFVELFNRSSTSVSLGSLSIQYASASGTGSFGANSGQLTELPDVTLQPGQYYLVQEGGGTTGSPLPAPDLIDSNPINLSGSAGKVALVTGITSLGCNAASNCSPEALARIIDLVGYGNANFFEGSNAAPTLSNTTAALRAANGCTDTDNNGADFAAVTPTPRNSATTLNPCSTTPPTNQPISASGSPSAITTTQGTAASSSLSASDPDSIVNSAAITSAAIAGITLDGFTAATADGGTATATLNVSADVSPGSYSVVVTFTNNEEQTADVTINVTVNGLAPCDNPATLISAIQGSGSSAAITGPVTVEGVVTGIFPGLNTINVQEEQADEDGNPNTSEGIAVFLGNNFASLTSGLLVGDVVQVSGTVGERSTNNGASLQTQISGTVTITDCAASSTSTPVDVTFPLTSISDLERYESMLVRFPQQLSIAEYFNYDRFGEIVLGYADGIAELEGRDRFYTPTNIVEPGAAANALAAEYALRQITLDDAISLQNPAFLRHPNGEQFTLQNRFRGGDLVGDLTGVIENTFGIYRMQPTAPATYTPVNPRPAAPEGVGGRLQVGAFNTLNYFLTLDYPTGDPRDNTCGAAANAECRGADDAGEFERQRAKLVEAIKGLDADALGLNELENTPGVEPLADIVDGLNADLGAGTYAYIDTGVIGTDAIKVGIIYKPAMLRPVGEYAILDSSVDPRFIDTRNRPALAQTFEEVATGARFTMVVNHLKSKGSGCGAGDDDTTNGQGNCNLTRTRAAQAMVDWLERDPTGGGDADYLIVGDLNSYAKEDPIDAIIAGADDQLNTSDDYTNLIDRFQGRFAYSYVFDGQLGYLDHALSSATLTGQVTGATEWHINADEPDVLDYDTSFKPSTQDALYEPNAYRTSDHDPVIVGLSLTIPNRAPVAADDSYSVNEDTALTVPAPGVLGNDSDADNNALVAELVSGPGNGTLTLNADGSFNYTPNANFNGSDSFGYRASDGTTTSEVATVTIAVNAVNDAPTAEGQTITVPEDGTANITLNANDIDGDTLSYTIVNGPQNGTLSGTGPSLSYTPKANYNGADSFTFKVNDGTVDSNVATVTITITPVNDAPIAQNDQANTKKGKSVNIAVLGNDSDVDGDRLTITAIGQVLNGRVTINTNGTLTYTPNDKFRGTEVFTYTVSDGKGGTATATVTVTVN